ncbi:electron transport complex subunit RsxG [Leucothrix arctica]|uniref:Ion-translocating oxidoreductase complex subunit G n=1 Tax=Leucothrix arctica TaxID=1481894 RepID=A0A317C5R6_9GAMM|nr:electron transport complex subunit RsxG [Leucothrix arctica]
MTTNKKAILTSGITLGLFALVGVVLLVVVQWFTKDQIIENQRQTKLQRLQEVVPASLYDNDMLATISQQSLALKGLGSVANIYTAKQGDDVTAIVYEVVSTQGYSGPINLLVAVDQQGALTGVRVVTHKETPGLGDKIDTNKSDWILEFVGKSLENPTEALWKVRKDGGEFDQFTGATITPRAVVNAVREVLKFHQVYYEASNNNDYTGATRLMPAKADPAGNN